MGYKKYGENSSEYCDNSDLVDQKIIFKYFKLIYNKIFNQFIKLYMNINSRWKDIFNKPEFEWNSKLRKIKNDKDFIALTKHIYPKLNNAEVKSYYKLILQNNNYTTLYDYGSGNGALFYLVNKKTNLLSWEVNREFVKFQKKIFKNRIKIFDINNQKYHKKIDLSVVNSVFQYFQNKKFVFETILNLIKNSNEVFIGDIKNIKYKKKFQIEQMKRQNLDLKQYKKKYKNLNPTYFSRNEILSFLEKNKNLISSYTIFNMPNYYPDAKFGSFGLRILTY